MLLPFLAQTPRHHSTHTRQVELRGLAPTELSMPVPDDDRVLHRLIFRMLVTNSAPDNGLSHVLAGWTNGGLHL